MGTTERQQITSIARANGWGIATAQIIETFSRGELEFTIEWSGPRSGYTELNYARGAGGHRTFDAKQVIVWLTTELGE